MNGPAPYGLAARAQPFTYGPNDGTEKVALSKLITASTLVAGSVLHVRAGGLITTTGGSPELDVRLRLGPVTLTGAILGAHNDSSAPNADLTWRLFNSNNVSNKGWSLWADITVQPNGTDTTTVGLLCTASNGQAQFGVLPVEEAALVAFNPAVDNLLELTLDWDDVAANTCVVKGGLFALVHYA